jgi:hypothetical protein
MLGTYANPVDYPLRNGAKELVFLPGDRKARVCSIVDCPMDHGIQGVIGLLHKLTPSYDGYYPEEI